MVFIMTKFDFDMALTDVVCQHLIRQLFKGVIICILVAISNRATREYESYCTN